MTNPTDPTVETPTVEAPSFKEGKTKMNQGEFEPTEPSIVTAVSDVPVQVSVVLGSITMPIANLLKLGRGAVVQLQTRVGENVEVLVNNRLVAKGEIVILDEHLGVTLTDIVRTDYL